MQVASRMVVLGLALFSLMLSSTFSLTGRLRAAEPKANLVRSEYRPLVPHRLLSLLHAPEVHEELGLSTKQVADLEVRFAETDGQWFRSRILKPQEQFAELDRLEADTRQWLAKNFQTSQVSRLNQLEWQSLGTRMLLRDDLAAKLKLTSQQQQKFADIAKQSKDGREANERENKSLRTLLTEEQHRKLPDIVGQVFDTQNLRRIYPLAPEFVSVEQWVNSEPLTLKSLRGKVVLVHFYAFQCHNCQANFDIYRRWHDSLAEKGVVLIGIQSPETNTERDPKAVCKAALDEKLEFPIMLDLKMDNWNEWANTMWPTVYVIDKKGYLRHWWQGELNWKGATADKTIEEVVNAALAE